MPPIPGISRPEQAKARLRKAARCLQTSFAPYSKPDPQRSDDRDVLCHYLVSGSRRETTNRTFVREWSSDDEPARENEHRLHCSALRERPSGFVRVFSQKIATKNPRFTSLSILENCTEKNFHVPNMKAGLNAYFRARSDVIS